MTPVEFERQMGTAPVWAGMDPQQAPAPFEPAEPGVGAVLRRSIRLTGADAKRLAAAGKKGGEPDFPVTAERLVGASGKLRRPVEELDEPGLQ